MEEDIKVLEELGCISKLTKGMSYDDGIDFVFALNKLIEKYRELESEIQHKNDQLFLIDKQNERHSIPKSKVKEKIEEYENMIKATYEDRTYYGDRRRDICIEIKQVLQEILEKE